MERFLHLNVVKMTHFRTTQYRRQATERHPGAVHLTCCKRTVNLWRGSRLRGLCPSASASLWESLKTQLQSPFQVFVAV